MPVFADIGDALVVFLGQFTDRHPIHICGYENSLESIHNSYREERVNEPGNEERKKKKMLEKNKNTICREKKEKQKRGKEGDEVN